MSHDGQAIEDDDQDQDPDTNLILDYLSNHLAPEDASRLEDRAKRDKAFRYKLADIVMLKGLVTMALERNSGGDRADCKRARRMFPAYLRGRTSPSKTAQLSRHLDECLDCDTEFERFRESRGAMEETRSRWARCRRVLSGLIRWPPWRRRARS